MPYFYYSNITEILNKYYNSLKTLDKLLKTYKIEVYNKKEHVCE